MSTPIRTYIRYLLHNVTYSLGPKKPQILKHVNLGTVGLSYPTIEGLQNDRGVSIQLLHCLPEKYVKVFAGIIARDSELVNAGDFMKLSLVR